jgi:GNAT superfamily N-acetyltransferase
MQHWSVSFDRERLDLDATHAWLRGSYWSPGVRRDIIATAFANSEAIIVHRGDEQLGVARVVTDRATFAWLCDVFVAEHARGQGIARAMVRAALAHPDLRTLRRWCLATRDAHRVYATCGFRSVEPGAWMQYVPDPSLWR